MKTYYSLLLRACDFSGKCYFVRVFITVLAHFIQLGVVVSIITTHFPFLTLYLLLIYVLFLSYFMRVALSLYLFITYRFTLFRRALGAILTFIH